jgi:hypothetical protein
VTGVEGDYAVTVTFRFIGYGTTSQAEKTVNRMMRELSLINMRVNLLSRSVRFENDDSGADATFRTGRKVPHTIYLQVGSLPSDADVFIGSARTEELADELVNAANRDPIARIAEWLAVDVDPEALAEEIGLNDQVVKVVRDALIRKARNG